MILANLQIQNHNDYLVMLKAIRILVQERPTQDAGVQKHHKVLGQGVLSHQSALCTEGVYFLIHNICFSCIPWCQGLCVQILRGCLKYSIHLLSRCSQVF
ncbi:hypothetical protein QTO34_019598 [Cnephaeus nilssonii]|uniref:Uncharacterized protein n=1 Tax=Cnephaeus nilssonii TaxID=3371016 RepID=A0AA40HXQ7_CNENI|nr:hypothetical protein QTO34_019598 [Eptesicus nilssonii]